jgi:hypothetical protein
MGGAWKWVRIGVVAVGVVVLAGLGWHETTLLLSVQPMGIDFMPMWAAGHEAFAHPERVYDFYALTRWEHPMLADFHGLRPFVYPPTALLLFAPLALAPFTTANAVWTIATTVFLLAAMAPFVKSPRTPALLAMLLMPASVLVALTGQLTFLIAGLVALGLFLLKPRPLLAGVLFGLAGVIKPQALVLLPVALIAAREWRTMAATAAAATAAIALSLVVFGVQAWTDWFAALPRFEHWVMAVPQLQRGMITPTALGNSLAFDASELDTWRLLFAGGALAMVWSVFFTSQDPARRMAALLGGSLFISPYAMHYDAALLAPVAALLLTDRQHLVGWLIGLAASIILCFAAIPHWGAAATTAFILIAVLVPETAFSRRASAPVFAAQRPEVAT